MAVFFASHAHALDSARASGDAGGAQKTKPFGKLSLSLSLTLSVPASKPAPPASTVKASDAQPGQSDTKAKTLSELNAEIAAMEAMIKAQQKQLEIVPASPASPVQALPIQTPSNKTSPQPSPALAPPADIVPADPVQAIAVASGVATAASGVGHANPRPEIVAPTVRPASAEKNSLVELPGMDWAIGLAVLLLATLGFIWYRRRQAVHVGEPFKYQGASETYEEPKPASLPGTSVAPVPAFEPAIKSLAGNEQPEKLQAILPPEYEMLEEADIYLRFGHDKLAEEALREAIKINPKNPQAYLTLLRIFFAREDSAAFLALAQQLKSLGDESVWPRVAEMGRNLDADNPLYH